MVECIELFSLFEHFIYCNFADFEIFENCQLFDAL